MGRLTSLGFLTLLHLACGLEITSEGRHRIANPGDTVTMECTVAGSDFNVFNNPVNWYKVLEDDDVAINNVGLISDPFKETERYTLDASMPGTEEVQVSMPLTITGMTYADNGTYRCDVISKDDAEPLSSVTYTILMPAEIQELELFTNKTKVVSSGNSTELIYEFMELEPTYVGCKSVGGNPKPQVRVYRDKVEITPEFTTTVTENKVGPKGLEEFTYEVSVFDAQFRAAREQRGQELKCVARIHKMPLLRKASSGIIEVKYPPRFTCNQMWSTVLQAKDYVIACRVLGNPAVPVETLYWSLDGGNGTVNLTMGEAHGVYKANATVDEEDGVIDLTLTIAEVNETSLQTYRLRAKNDLGEEHYEITLYEATTTVPSTTSKPTSPPKDNGYDVVGGGGEHPETGGSSGGDSPKAAGGCWVMAIMLATALVASVL